MSCGAAPIGHKKFCRQCGVGLNPEQIVCIKCGTGVATGASRSIGTSQLTNFGSGDLKNLLAGFGAGGITILVAAALALFSFFLPWVDVGMASANAIRNGGFLFGLVFVYPVWMVLAKKSINQIGGYLCAAIGIGLGVLHVMGCKKELFGESINVAGIGAYLFTCTCIALIVGIVLQHRQSNHA